MARSTRTSQLNCIAYLSMRTNTLYVSRRYRAQVAKRLGVESHAGREWFLPRRGYTVSVCDVEGFVGAQLMEDREGDERIRKGFKCGANHPEAHKACTPIDSTTSYDYMGYSECTRGEPEYLANGPRADRFAPYLEGREPLLVYAIEIYEVYKVIRRDLSEERALEAISALRRATIAPVDDSLALDAADISLSLGLAMADSIVYATARRHGAQLVTTDTDFEGLPDAIVVR